MFNPTHIETLAKKLFQALPESIQSLEKDIQEQFKDILQSAFTRMNLVTREEFDIQAKVLARTREKVDMMQTQVNALLNELNKPVE